MIQFLCDWCSRVKGPDETWILGQAAEALGVTSARREVTILSAWDRSRAVDALGVHFCSLACKDKYLAQLFSPWVATDKIAVERAVPAEIVLEHIVPTQKSDYPRVQRKKSRPRKRAA